jgi:LPXTG-motif cell wall-anchored protein
MAGAVTITSVAVAVLLGAPAWAGPPSGVGQRADPTPSPGPDANQIPITLEVTTQPVTPSSGGGGGVLPVTGTDIAELVVAGLALVTSGGVVIIAGRRRGRPRRLRRRAVRVVSRLSQGIAS